MELGVLLSRSGYTANGTPVIAGLFRLHDTHGWNLSACCMALAQSGAMADWESFLDDAAAAGWSYEKARSCISDAAFLGWGREFQRALMERLN